MSLEKNVKPLVNLKHFTPYTPEASADVYHGAAYLKSEDGQDWYECQKLFADDTLKFTYDDKGIITCITKDVSGLWPYGQSVAEVPDMEEYSSVDISGEWVFDGEKIIPRSPSRDELIARAEKEKQRLMQRATDAIAPLQDAVDIDEATDEEKSQLLSWKKYRVLLNRVDTSTAPDITWPEMPNNVA